MKMIWDFSDYRAYLFEKIGGLRARTGAKKRLAQFLRVHTTFVSQVLTERAHFSLEQGETINQFLSHTEDEGEYFLLLLMKARAGSKELESRFQRKISQIKKDKSKIKERISPDAEVAPEVREKFYSTPLYAAIHVLCSIPEFGTVEQISNLLNLPRQKVAEMFSFLEKAKVIAPSNQSYLPTNKHIHLSPDSDLLIKHHQNWRLHTAASLHFNDSEDIHYSAILSISERDVEKVKESLLSNLQQNVEVVTNSKDECAFVYCMDFYRWPKVKK